MAVNVLSPPAPRHILHPRKSVSREGLGKAVPSRQQQWLSISLLCGGMKLGWALDCVPPPCWAISAGSCPPTAIKRWQVAHQPLGRLGEGLHQGCPQERQGSQNKHKIAARKREGWKYCSYEGVKNKNLQIRWVPHLYLVWITWTDWKEVDIRYTEVEGSFEEKAKSLSC